MTNNVVHFAIQADDLVRAQQFYGAVFGWRFEAWGPPDFYRIHTGDAANPGIEGALEKRHAPLLNGNDATRGFTCTIAVADIKSTRTALKNNGATIRFEGEIPTIGKLIHFEDCEGNLVSAMQYEQQALDNMRRGI